MAHRLYAEQQTAVDTICQMFKVSRATFYRYVAQSDVVAPTGDTKP